MGTDTEAGFLDDVSGRPAAEAVEFGFDGQEFVINLSCENAEALRAALQPYVDAGRRVDDRRLSLTHVATRVNDAAVRAWASSNGLKLAARGRLPGFAIEQYQAACH